MTAYGNAMCGTRHIPGQLEICQYANMKWFSVPKFISGSGAGYCGALVTLPRDLFTNYLHVSHRLNFKMIVNSQKTRMMGLFYDENCIIFTGFIQTQGTSGHHRKISAVNMSHNPIYLFIIIYHLGQKTYKDVQKYKIVHVLITGDSTTVTKNRSIKCAHRCICELRRKYHLDISAFCV